jgi:hypothetical protein
VVIGHPAPNHYLACSFYASLTIAPEGLGPADAALDSCEAEVDQVQILILRELMAPGRYLLVRRRVCRLNGECRAAAGSGRSA